jgi:plasmid stabilization system protein ParE
MARKVVFRPAAERDLAALYTYIRDANGGPEVAIGYVRRIRSFCEGLELFPERGVARDDIRQGLRLAFFEKRVVVAFTISTEQVRIGRILYGGRNYAALLADDDGGMHSASTDNRKR